MTAIEHAPYYRPIAAAMWRASVLTKGVSLPPWPGGVDNAGAWRCWLAQVWAVRTVAEAVALASPALAEQIEQVLAGRRHATAQLRRMAMSLARYLVRARGRATPYGTFAGIGPVSYGAEVRLGWSEDHRLRVRADAVWLADIIARLEACPPLLERLPVVVNDLAVVRGGRLVVPWQPHLSTAVRDRAEEAVEVSVRLIPTLETIRREARSPIRVGALVDKVAADHPGATREALRGIVGRLVTSGVLVSSLRAPATCTDPLGHLLSELEAAPTADVPDISVLVDELRTVHDQVTGRFRGKAWSRERDRHSVTGRMRALSKATDRPVAVDLRLGGTLVLPRSVADEAAAAAGVLIRLTPQTSASTSWRAYHRDFLARYGPGTLVPVADLADPAVGLGFPAHFTVPPGGREVTLRDEVLLALAQQAAWDGSHEIVLDQATLDSLAPETADVRRPTSAVDLTADLRARSHEALNMGEFTLAVCGFGRIGATTGRFLELLGEGDRHETMALYASLPTGVHRALAAQLSFPPRHVRSENVLRVAPVLPHLIPMAEHRDASAEDIPVADLAIAADSTRLYVISRSRHQVVEPVLLNAGARHTMPPLARLLFEIPRSPHPAVTTFDWGAAACLPYLPRVRYGRSILAPARWRIDPADLPGSQAPEDQWASAWESVRARRHLPAAVSVGDSDRRLRLDLDHAMDLAVLRSRLQAADGPVTVAEAPTEAEHGWCDGRTHELVIPLAATEPPDPAPAFLSSTTPPPVADPKDGVGMVFAKLYGPSETADAILTQHLPTLLAQWETPPRWWFVRYHHPAPHLRLRLHATDYQQAAGAVADWAEDLRREGLVGEIAFDAYRPETGRYGTGTALEAAETLFAADSAAVLAQLAFLSAHQDIPPQALTAASLVDLAAAVTGGRAAGLGWLLDHPQYADGAAAQDRTMRRHTLRLTQNGALQALPGGAGLAAAWVARTDGASDYSAQLVAQAIRPTPEEVLGSLLHLHHIRVCGPDPTAEATTYKLARAVALAYTARPTERPHKGGDQ